MDHAKWLYLIDEFDPEYERVQRQSAVVGKARSAVQLTDTLRSSKLDDHEMAPQYVTELHRYLNVTAPPPAVWKRVAARRISTADASSSSTEPYFRPTQTRSQLRQQQQLLHEQQQQQQLLQRQ